MRIPKCRVCAHPKVEEINQAFLSGMPQSQIVRDIAPDLSKNSVQHHFAKDHQDRDLSQFTIPAGGSVPSRPAKPTEPKTKRTTATSKAQLEDPVKVHWEIPRTLLKKLKHKAIDQDTPVVELARQYIRYGVEKL